MVRISSWLALAGALLITLPLPTFFLWKLHFAALETCLIWAGLGALGLARGQGRARWVGAVAGLIALLPALRVAPVYLARDHAWSPLAWLYLAPPPEVEPQRDVVLTPERPELVVDLYPGVGPAPRPAVLVVHGGSWARGDKGEVAHLSRRLAAQGTTVLDLRYRLSGEAPFPAGVADVRCALRRIGARAAELGVDPARVTLLGRSAGGHMVLLAGATAGDPTQPASCEGADLRPHGIIALYPTGDLAWSWDHVPTPDLIGSHEVLRWYLGGSPDEQPQRYRDATPMTWLDPDDPPALLVHGLGDRMVSPHHSEAYVAAAHAVGADATLVEIPAADHGFDVRRGGFAEQIAAAEIDAFLAR